MSSSGMRCAAVVMHAASEGIWDIGRTGGLLVRPTRVRWRGGGGGLGGIGRGETRVRTAAQSLDLHTDQ